MKDDKKVVLERLENVRNYYNKFEKILDDLPFFIPSSTKTMLKDHLGQDKELNELMNSIVTQRPPRLLIVGDDGVGKSALVNAICGAMVVQTANKVHKDIDVYSCKRGGVTELEVFETRASGDEDKIMKIANFNPDVGILLLDSTGCTDIDSQLRFFAELKNSFAAMEIDRLPVIVVIGKADDADEDDYEVLMNAGEEGRKVALTIDINRNYLREAISHYRSGILSHGNVVDEIIAVSALNLYNIGEFRKVLENLMKDPNAQMGFRMTFRLPEVMAGVAYRIVKLFSGLAAVVALTPIPIADLYVLLILQSFMVGLIARLSGRNINIKTAFEFILSLGGVTVAGFALRTVAQQISKFANIIPFAGSAISSTIAATGTTAIGRAAVAHFISDLPLRKTRSLFKHLKKSSK
ncbi:AAA family ATPase [Anaerovoracaceae bacterium SGI.195]